MQNKRLSIITASLCVAALLMTNIGNTLTYAEESSTSTETASSIDQPSTKAASNTQDIASASTETTTSTTSTQNADTLVSTTDMTKTIGTNETTAEQTTTETITETVTNTTTTKDIINSKYILQYKAAEGGTVSSSEETVSSQNSIKGSTAAPDNDHTFDGWYKDDELITKDLALIPTVDFTAQTEDTSTTTEAVSATTETQKTADTSVTQVYTAKFTEIAPVVLEKEIDGRKITVKGIHIPEGAELSVVSVSNKDAEKTVNELNDDKATFTADVSYDISILVDGKVWQPADHDTTVTVSITNIDKDKITENDKELKVYRISDDKKEITDIDATVKEDVANFDTNHFTIYTIGGLNYDIADNWYTKYDYDINGTNIELYNYIGPLTTWIAIPATATIDGVTYNVVLKHNIAPNIKLAGRSVSEVNNGYCSIWESIHNNLTKIAIENGVKGGTDCTALFAGLLDINFTYSDINTLDTSNTENMSFMFYNCQSMAKPKISNWNTSKVIDMSHMFEDCEDLSFIDISNFNTSQVTSMESMFDGCKTLSFIGISNFDTTSTTNMCGMFSDCTTLASLDLSKFNTNKVTDMSFMFSGCKTLTSLDLSKFNTNKVTDMSFMFNYDTVLTSINFTNFDTSSVTTMRKMFCQCPALTKLDISSFDTLHIIDMSDMFRGCDSLIEISFGKNFRFADIDYKNAQENYFNYKTSEDSAFSRLHNSFFGTYTDCWVLDSHDNHENPIHGYDFSTKFNTSLGNMAGTWYAEKENNGGAFLVKGTDFASIVRTVSNGGTISTFVISQDADTSGTICTIDESPVKAYMTYENNVITIHAPQNTEIYLNSNSDCMFPSVISLDLGIFNGSKLTSCQYMFGGNKMLTSVNFEHFYAPLLITTDAMFDNCTSLTTINVSGLNAPHITDMSSMFNSCTSLVRVVMNGMNTSNVTNMGYMFARCRALTTVDLDEIDVSSLQNASYMFVDDYMLQNIDISKWNTKSLQNTYWMFYHESNWWKASSPELTHLTSIDLHNWDTSKLTNAEGMFGHCNGLISANLSGWNTDSLQNCSDMFYGCACLTDINVKDWDTTNIDNMYEMFSYCLSLEKIDISNFNTRKAAANSKCNLFYSCEYLDTITLSNDCIDIGLPNHQESYNLYPHYSSNHDTTLYNTYTGDWVSGSHASHFDSGEKVLSKADNLAGTWYAERFPNIVILNSYDFNGLLSGCANGPNNIKNIIVKDDIKEEDIIEQSWNANTVLDNGIFTGTQISYTNHQPCNGYGTVPATGKSVKPQNAYAIYNNGTITIHTPKDAEIFITDGGGDFFHDFSSLESVELDKFDVSHITGMYQTFANCSSLKSLDLSSWDISNAKHVCQTFSGCSSLESLDISNFDSSIMADTQEYEMFKGCNSLSQITLGPKFKFLGQDVYDETGALVSSNTCFFTPTIPENTFTGNWVRTSYSAHTGQIASKDFKDTFNTDPTTMAGTWYAEKNYLTVTYDKNGADSGTVPAVSLPDVGAAMTVANNTGNLTKAGYTFAGWNTKTDGSGDNYQSGNAFAPTSNTTLYVEWSKDIVVSSVNNNSDASTSSNGTSTKSKKLANNIPQSESNTNNENSTLGTKTSPFTGDNAEILLYVIIMIISASIMIRLYVVKKKKSHISV